MTTEELARLIVKIEGDTSGFRRDAARAERAAKDVGRRMEEDARKSEVFGRVIDDLGTKMSNMAGQMRAMAGLEMPFDLVKSGVHLAGEAEAMEISFEVMLGTADKAKAMMADLQAFSAKTPLTMPGLTQATKTLLQFGVAGEDVVPVLKTLGDVSGGEQDKLSRMALAFGQMSSTGRLMGEELNQMIEAGFNPLKEISRTTGKSMLELREDMERGRISTSMVTEAFRTATKEGGPMAGMLEKQSKSFKGLFSTMTDDLDAFRRSVGAVVIDQFHLKEAMEGVSSAAQGLTEWFSKLDRGWKTTAAVVVTAVAGMGMLVVAWKVGAIAIGMVVGVLKDVVITLKWVIPLVRSYTAAVLASNAAMVAFKVAVVAGVVYAVMQAVNALVGGRKAMADFNKELERGAELSDRLRAGGESRVTRTVEAAVDIKNPEERLKFLQEQLAVAERNAAGLEGALKSATSTMDKTDTTFHFIKRNIPLWGAGHAAEFEAMGKSVDEARKDYEAARAAVTRLRDAVKSVKLPGSDPATVQAVKEANRRLEEQARLFGLSGHEAEVAKLKYMGATEEQLANARGVAAMLAEAEKSKKVADDVKSLTDSLREQADAAGLDADSARLHALAVRGATEEQLEEARALTHKRDILRDHAALREEASRAVEESIPPLMQLENRIARTGQMFREGMVTIDLYRRILGGAVTREAMTPFERLEERVKETTALFRAGAISLETYRRALGGSVTQEVATPLERFNDRLRELQLLFDAGAISGDVFNRAVNKSAADLGLVEERANAARDAVRGIDAALAGSADARARIMAQEDRFRRTDPSRSQQVTRIQLSKAPNDPAAQETNKLLKQAAKSLDKVAAKPTFTVEPVGFSVGGP